ncbi:MAG TPA: hypothetical protein VJC03_06140, partial [bacterium]|nr:hypothetical protein [bacterium]
MNILDPPFRDNGISWEEYLLEYPFQFNQTVLEYRKGGTGSAYDLSKPGADIFQLGAEFNFGMILPVMELEAKQDRFRKIMSRFDRAIHPTTSPLLLFQGRETYNSALIQLEKRLYEKALTAFKEFEKKNESDFFSQFYCGRLCLYGKTPFVDLIDLSSAGKYLASAVRSASMAMNEVPELKLPAAESCFHAAVASYLEGNRAYSRSEKEFRAHYENALLMLEKALEFRPDLKEAVFFAAKCSALLEEKARSIQYYTRLSETEGYDLKLDKDGDFLSIKDEIVSLKQETRSKLRVRAEKELENIRRVLASSNFEVSFGRKLEGRIIELNRTMEQFIKEDSGSTREILLLLEEYGNLIPLYAEEVFKGSGGALLSLCFSPDGKLLAGGGMDASLRIWDIPEIRLLKQLKERHGVIGVFFAPGGKKIISMGLDETITEWDAGKGAVLRSIQGYSLNTVAGSSFSPDGKYLLSFYSDSAIMKLWDLGL